MKWCENCAKYCLTGFDPDTRFVACTECGRVIEQDDLTDEITFVKGAGGESRLAGSYVRSMQSDLSESYQRTLKKGYDEIHCQMIQLTKQNENKGLEDQASYYYQLLSVDSLEGAEPGAEPNLLLHHPFKLLAAYVNSRYSFSCQGCKFHYTVNSVEQVNVLVKNQPYLLIDFAKELSVNVYVLGAVFLQLCKLLSLEEHPIVQKLVDPTLFMHRFASPAEKPETHYIRTFEKSMDDSNLIDEDNLSDIDDVEVNLYLHSEEEIRFKKIIWEEMNKEYIEEQAAKQAAAAAAASQSYGYNPDDVREARELAAETAAALAKTREAKRQKRALDAKNAVPPQTAAEATKQMLVKKGLSSKINYEEFYKLFDESDDNPLLKDDIREDDNEQEENKEDMSENNVGDEWCGGEQNLYNYDDYDHDHDNYEGEW